jgi:hypothetical protein
MALSLSGSPQFAASPVFWLSPGFLRVSAGLLAFGPLPGRFPVRSDRPIRFSVFSMT